MSSAAPNAKRVKGPIPALPVNTVKVSRQSMIALLQKFSTQENVTLLKTSNDTQVGHGLPKLDVKLATMM